VNAGTLPILSDLNNTQQVSPVFRNLTSLVLSATLFLMSSAALAQSAEWADPVCSFADKEMLVSLHLENSKPAVDRKEKTCIASAPRDGVYGALSISSSPSSLGAFGVKVIPAHCSSSSVSNFWVTTCTAATKNLMFNVTHMEKDNEEGKRLATVLSAHFERRIKELNK
jgi:hypothetical protein